MTPVTSQTIDLTIWKEIAGLNLSPSHDRWHIDRVLEYAKELAKIYGGDLEVLTAAVIMHDLGRHDPSLRGIESSKESAELAEKMLRRAQFPPTKIQSVLTAISEHDQPDLRPSTLEGRILKDADFLAGFGPWGVLRIAMWVGETKGGVDQVFDRLENRMPKRLEGLEFPESRRIGKREMAFSRLFGSLLRKDPELKVMNQKGVYIVLEGISGSGKDTQAGRLRDHLTGMNRNVLVLSEPTMLYKQARDLWEDQKGDPLIQTFLLMADRYKQIKLDEWPALEAGQVVISVRSYLSTVVYQASKANQQDFIDFFHQFVPIPDAVFILDLPAEEAYRRIADRTKAEDRKLGDFETTTALEQLRTGYLQMVQHRPGENFVVIDAQKSIDEIENEIWQYLLKAGIIMQQTTPPSRT